jgi:hypothetical protein
VLFGTDAGYMTVLDPTEEYVRLAEAGLTPMQILAALTTAPAARWRAPTGVVRWPRSSPRIWLSSRETRRAMSVGSRP